MRTLKPDAELSRSFFARARDDPHVVEPTQDEHRGANYLGRQIGIDSSKLSFELVFCDVLPRVCNY